MKKVRDAVTSTDGEAILYGGIPILAVFHSSSAGLTRLRDRCGRTICPT